MDDRSLVSLMAAIIYAGTDSDNKQSVRIAHKLLKEVSLVPATE